MDHDILHTQSNIAGSEKTLGKKFSADFGAKAAAVNPRDYTVANFG